MVSSTVSPETATTPAREIGNGIQAAKSTSGAGGGRGGARSEEDPAVRATLAAQTRFDSTSASAGDRLIGRWNSWRRSRIRACVEEGWPTAARGRIARGRGYNLIRHILLSSCVSADDGGEDRGDRKDAKLPNLTWYRMPGCSPRSPTKTAYSFSTNRCWARDRRDDDPPRRNSAGRRLRNFAPKVTVELQTELEASSERALRSVNRRNCWRRRQDSNLRALSGQRFSRPPPSASRPLLRACDLARLRDPGALDRRRRKQFVSERMVTGMTQGPSPGVIWASGARAAPE